jgi:hypothetical protein
VNRARTLAHVYRHFDEVGTARTSPLYRCLAIALGGSDEALRATEAASARKRHPSVILDAPHDPALAGRAAYAAADGDAAAGAAIDTLLELTDLVAAIARRRPVRTVGTQSGAVLYPAITEQRGAWARRRSG